MAIQILKKGAMTTFFIGLLITAVISVIGMVYLTQMAFSNEKLANGQYCGNTDTTQRNIARVGALVLWIQFAWIVLGSFIQPVWK
jgi:hypothetical protein